MTAQQAPALQTPALQTPALQAPVQQAALGRDTGKRTAASGTHEAPVLEISGARLDEDELAALTAMIGQLASAEPVAGDGAGTPGPWDRTLQRRRRLGLWGRPGPDSWQHAAGLR